ncbi:ATP-binding protein [Actinacidiphila yeochonensis]|uniref:hypothetical protein n=1 Tax=Actinacidiphila yeochonensis TaxID=89050 RepID=UPI000691F2AD|nr:hypothetical protein [Actinacidiphila yeochonensis]
MTPLTARTTTAADPARAAARPRPARRPTAGVRGEDWSIAHALGDEDFALLHFDVSPESPDRARLFARRTLAAWSLERAAEAVAAVAGELVGHAVRHAGREGDSAPAPGAWVALAHRAGSVVCAVHHPGPSTPLASAGFAEVARLSSAWGVSPPGPGGRTVWAALPVVPAVSAPAAAPGTAPRRAGRPTARRRTA